MSSDPPYWGRLPPPRSVEANPRRLSDDLPAGASSLDRHATTPDAAAAQQPRAKPNRVSVQTTNTDAPTESTLSPFASPTRSSFQPQGLAPRPPSLPYAGDQYPPELWENRQRRRNKSQEQEQERDYHHYHYPDAGPGPLPAAPDVPPQAPPVSYKHPQGNGSSSLPYAYAAGGLARSFSSPTQMEGSHVYHSDDPNRGVPPPRHVSDSTRRGASTRDGARRSAAATEPSSQQQHHHPQRRSSLGQQQQQQQPDRRKFAVDRSPLQRLEKTLGSITKEEKRARVEAAERAVRERAAAAKQAGPVADEGGTLQQVRFGDPRGVKSGTREEGGAHPARPQPQGPPPLLPLRTRPPLSAPPSQPPAAKRHRASLSAT
ncbi:hypothetical protein VTK73DRAFT_3806 [Phialemonium thermophilum]|uniref:Uncharacterized protein n=1 Tax=Phialemonium thermophilum TaxID=223376 RepID=A0ABR3VEE1_9PEZI